MFRFNFSILVKKKFDFLIKEYGFVDHPSGLGFKKGSFEIAFYYGKGEIEIVIFINQSDEIFKPFISRSFDLIDIAKRNGYVYEARDRLGFVPSTDDVSRQLTIYANITRKYCEKELRGDFSLFEKIHSIRHQNEKEKYERERQKCR